MGNKFRLGRKIGSGSFGEIYLGSSLSQSFNSMDSRIRHIGVFRISNIRCDFSGTNIHTNEEVAIKLVSSCFSVFSVIPFS